jgi:hypothetical protein
MARYLKFKISGEIAFNGVIRFSVYYTFKNKN